jgi:DNA polymerase-3 subunit epsilon
MTGWHEGALAGFDLETTSPDPGTARIVTAAIVTLEAGRKPVTKSWLVNPGVPIPEEATAIHGITDEMARTKGVEPHVAAYEISAMLAGSVLLDGIPLVIYNAPYDLTVLDRETRRFGQAPFGDVLTGCSGCIVDPFVLDKHLDPYRKGKRTLTANCEHYRVSLDGAHEAGADALAAMRVAWKIAAANPAIAALSRVALHDLQVRAKAEQAASFQDYLRKQGSGEVIDGSWPVKPFAEVTV